MKRKFAVMLLAAAAVMAMTLPAFADVMWEPYGNDFYDAHRDECQYENRTYLANGSEGYLTLMESPQSVAEVYNVPNGERVYVGYLWTDGQGQQWAVGDYAVQEEGQTWKWYYGWAPLDELALIYDHLSFEEDHGSEFQEYDGSGDGLTEAYLYSYPNGSYQTLLVEAKEYQPFSETFQYLYTDENGLRWTFVGYYMGSRNAWVCIDDPLNENLGTDTPQTVAQVRGTGGELTARAASVPAARTWTVWLIPAALVVLAAAVTALLIRRSRGKNSAKKE